MSRIVIKNKGNFSLTDKFFETIGDAIRRIDLRKYGKMGVEALREATPKDSGKTADSWYYVIDHDPVTKQYTINWYNDNIADGWFPIAIMIQYGHATNNGGYVKGRDYINPALQSVFDELADHAWKEVKDS
ncbi:MAG: HK97 gp10 family phage protein [Methanobrevibacter sp.]|nr:HK97 gp10 family phage protein [Methanobrevibacter sp.]